MGIKLSSSLVPQPGMSPAMELGSQGASHVDRQSVNRAVEDRANDAGNLAKLRDATRVRRHLFRVPMYPAALMEFWAAGYIEPASAPVLPPEVTRACVWEGRMTCCTGRTATGLGPTCPTTPHAMVTRNGGRRVEPEGPSHAYNGDGRPEPHVVGGSTTGRGTVERGGTGGGTPTCRSCGFPSLPFRLPKRNPLAQERRKGPYGIQTAPLQSRFRDAANAWRRSVPRFPENRARARASSSGLLRGTR